MSNGSYVRRAGTTEVVLVPMLEASEDHVERLLAENERLRAEILFVEDRALLFHGENEELRLENARLKNELARAILSATKENTK